MVRVLFSFCMIAIVGASAAAQVRVGNPELSGRYPSGNHAQAIPMIEFDPNNMRAIIVGDSQVASSAASRIRVHMRNWDMPVGGTFIGTHFFWSGQEIAYDVSHIPTLTSNEVSNPNAWSGGGPSDFGVRRGYEWVCLGDVDDPDEPIGSYRHFMNTYNTVPWNYDWIAGRNVLIRVAMRTTPNSIPIIETRATRGKATDLSTRTIHKINREYGYQILEQIVPNDFAAGVDGTGVSFFLPDGVSEVAGETFQVLGVSLLVLGENGKPIRGKIIGANAYPGARVSTLLAISDASRQALIDLIDANTVIIMLGHNRDDLNGPSFEKSYTSYVGKWMQAFETTGRQPPTVINVVPWIIDRDWSAEYLQEVSETMESTARATGGMFLSYPERFDWKTPVQYDPVVYQFDSGGAHPGTDATARQLSFDLEEMLQDWISEH